MLSNNILSWFFLCWCNVLRWIWCLWCYSECISTLGKLEKYAWPRWESNIRPLDDDLFHKFSLILILQSNKIHLWTRYHDCSCERPTHPGWCVLFSGISQGNNE
jgi:hypothetical protein